jgi:hypothetical protein
MGISNTQFAEERGYQIYEQMVMPIVQVDFNLIEHAVYSIITGILAIHITAMDKCTNYIRN